MTAAIRHLIYERRWLEQAYDLAQIERERDENDSPLLAAQMDRLATEIAEIVDALDILNAVASKTRQVRLVRTAG